MRALSLLKRLLMLSLALFVGLLFYGHMRAHPEDLPWTKVDLTQPLGVFTGRKLAALDRPACQQLMTHAGVGYTALPARAASRQCGYDDAVRLGTAGALDIAYVPANLGASCRVAAGLALWEWHVVQPAALRHFGSPVTRIEHYGSFACRRLYGRSEGNWSEHARANAVDIAAFVLEDGRRVSVVRDWAESGQKAAFLRDVRDGACHLFATVLSPDYNAAHRDHLHLDQAERGASGWRVCR